MTEDFNPRSPNAMFAKILTRLDQQDRTAESERKEIKGMISGIHNAHRETALAHERRLQKLERWKDTSKAKFAGMILGASVFVTTAAWVIEHWPK
jgi:folate-dependent tRNA-U54 methylase TrmFO/GidA